MATTIATAAVSAYAVEQQRQSSKAAKRKAKQNEEAARLEKNRLENRQKQTERQRRNLLKRQLATQRARLAAAGVGGSGGSADAVLTGMEKRVAEDIDASRTGLGLNIADLNSRVSGRRRSLLGARNGFADPMIGEGLRFLSSVKGG